METAPHFAHELLDFVPDPYLETDTTGLIVEANRAAAALFGLANPLPRNQPLAEFVAPADHAVFLEKLARLLLTPGDWIEEWPVAVRPAPAAAPVALTARAAPIRDADTTLIGVRWLFRSPADASSPRVAEDRGEGRFRSLIQHASDLIMIVDESGTIRYASPSVEHVLGYPPAELIGKPVLNGLAEADADRLREHGREVLERPSRHPVQEVQVRHRDGSWRTLDVITTNLLNDPHVGGIVINAWDVTLHKLAEERLQFLVEATASLTEPLELDAILQRLTELAVPHLADWCAIDLVTENGAVERVAIVHATPERAALLEELERRYPRDWQADFGVAHVLRTGTVAFYPNARTAQPLADRDPVYADIMRRLAHRSYLCVPLIARDTTIGAMTFVAAESQRQYELADVGLALALARRAALAVENARLYDRAQSALAVRNQFLSVISHDLRQPLAVFRGAGELLHDRVNRLADPEAAWLAMKVERAAARTEAMINELVDLANLQTGHALPLVLHRANLVTIVRQLVTDQQQAGTHPITLEAVAPRLLGRWDIARIERVVTNLLSNAAKYSPEGSPITVTLHRAESIDGRPWAVLEIADEGIGIPVADRERVFELFHRGKNVAGQTRGLGIGLAGAKQIVDQHGGRLTVASWEGTGTVVTVWLPLDEEQPSEH